MARQRPSDGERWALKGAEGHRKLIRVSCTVFHLFHKWDGYPRTLREDKRRFRETLDSWYVTRPDGPRILWLLLPYSDKMSSTGFESHDPHIELAFKGMDDPLFINERAIKHKWWFLVVLFGAYLKRSGDFALAIRFYERLTKTRGLEAEGYLGLADIHHLLADWNLELDPYRWEGVYPDPPLTAGDDLEDSVSKMKSYSHQSAIDLYFKAVEMLPGSAYPRIHLARAQMSAGLTSEACRTLEEAAELAPSSEIARLHLSYARGLVGKPGWEAGYKGEVEASTLLAKRQREVIRAEIVSTANAAAMLEEPLLELTPPRTLQVASTVISDGKVSNRNIALDFPSPAACQFSNISDLGLGLKVVDGQYLLSDSRGLHLKQSKMFCPDVLAQDRWTALIGRPDTVPCGTPEQAPILLPGAMFNYYHWMFDSLGALLLYGEHVDLKGRDIFCAKPIEKYHRRTMMLALGHCNLKTVENLSSLTFDKAVHLQYPSRLNVPHPTVVEKLRAKFSKHASHPKAGRRVYISRKALPGREVNEEAIERHLRDSGFEVCDPGKMSFDEQVSFFSDVEAIAAAPGAALTNLILCPSQTKVVLLASALHHFETFTSIAATIGQPTYLCLSGSRTIPNSFFVWSVFHHAVDERDLKLALGAAGLN